MYIAIAIIVFGLLITVHELGHFLAAKSLGVKVNEFAIGMGPAIIKKQGRETLYSLRILPIGGFCALEGQDEDSSDPGSFMKKPIWKRFIILVAGSFMNFLAGFLILAALFSGYGTITTTTLAGFMEGFPNTETSYLREGDTFYSIDGERIFLSNDITTFLSRGNGKTADIVVIRDGKKVFLGDFPISLREYEVNGEKVLRYGIYLKAEKATLGLKLRHTWYSSISFVRMVRMGLSDLITGNVGVRELSGPIGIVGIINEVGSTAASKSAAFANIAYICAFIAINLAVMNMLPIPALDGGRIFFMLVTFVTEKILRRRINPKYENFVHLAGFVLLMGLMVFVFFNDILKLVRG
ncbi:MAG TPA: hypothetical protein GXZ65_09190 [Clostridiales bacterium]|jgi:regulator of sigma E protease|nr:hypothetical protein [Clostridiales bacterium]